MSLKYKAVLVWVICLSYKVVMTGGEVVLVNRNVTDSFRVGKDGCTNKTSVCTSPATCHSDGLCLCNKDLSNFRNPIIRIDNGNLVYGETYGCMGNDHILSGVGTPACPFKPFQVIPYSRDDQVTKFSHNRAVFNCSLKKALAKFPDNATEIVLLWLNESYVDINVGSNDLYFKWKRSVPDLQGTIITFSLYCQVPSSSGPKAYQTNCLRAKVFGTWSAEAKATTSTLAATTAPTNSVLNTSDTSDTTTPTTSAHSSPPGKVSSSDGDSSGTIIAIAIVVPIVLLIVLVVVIWMLCKRKNGNRPSPRKSSGGYSGKMNGSTNMKPFKHTDSNLRGPDAYDDIPVKDTNKPFGAQSNLGSSTPDNQRVIVQANPTYSTPDIKNVSNNHPEPGYEPVAVKKREVNKGDSQEDPGYATPDFNRRDIDRVNSYPEPGYETPDSKRKDVNDATLDPAYSMADKNVEEDSADIKRVEINGDLYAFPEKNKNTTKINGLNYMNPSHLVSDNQDSNESQEQASQPTEYAHIVGVMKPGPKKKM